MPNAAQQYVLMQEQMHKQKDSTGAGGQPVGKNNSSPLFTSNTARFSALRESSATYNRADSFSSPMFGSQYLSDTTRSNGDSYANFAPNYTFPPTQDQIVRETSSQYEISNSVPLRRTPVNESTTLSPKSRRLSFAKSRQCLTPQQLLALESLEEAADGKRKEVAAKELMQRNELQIKIEAKIAKREKEEALVAAKLRERNEKLELKALKKEVKDERKGVPADLPSSRRVSIVAAEPSTAILSPKSLSRNPSIGGSFAGSTSDLGSVSNASFVTQRRVSFSDKAPIAATTTNKKKKVRPIAPPPYPYTAPKYVSKYEDRDIVLQPMAFAPCHLSPRPATIASNAKGSAKPRPALSNLTNVSYRHCYKAPKYIAHPDDRPLLGQPTAITAVDKASEKKQKYQPSKWDAYETTIARDLYTSAQSVRKNTFLSQIKDRDALMNKFRAGALAILLAEESKKRDALAADEDNNRSRLVALERQGATEAKKQDKVQRKQQKGKKSIWNALSCKKEATIRRDDIQMTQAKN
eukprot:GILI01002537.1.p1 GENE.GILI01002537.1~~GILI01002537.1.p1  ORF type:complete len:538 (-),score=105.36 GILI01002537.1:167-1738(-)